MRSFLVFVGLLAQVFANGGGYFRGGVEGAGSLKGFEPENTEKVQMAEELLKIHVHEDYADVKIRYLMRNLKDEKVKVRFGFPVEESLDQGMTMGMDPSGKPEKNDADRLEYCESYRVQVGNDSLKAKWKGEKTPKGDKRFETIAGWWISDLQFGPSEEKEVRISFRSHFPEESLSVSDDGFTKAALFRYRLSTAAVWGEAIEKGRIELIPVGVEAADLKVIKPVNCFKREGDSWVWGFSNLEPTLEDDLEIEVRPEIHEYWRGLNGQWDHENESWAKFVGRPGRWTMCHDNYEARASSTLEPQGQNSYGTEKLKEWEAAWSEGAKGNGVGEWLEFKAKVPKRLRSVLITPGYAKTDELFQANARPKCVEVVLNGEHRFEATLLDKSDQQTLLIKDYDKPVEVVKLTFKEVYPGKRFADMCVSSVRLEAILDKKPEITPAR